MKKPETKLTKKEVISHQKRAFAKKGLLLAENSFLKGGSGARWNHCLNHAAAVKFFPSSSTIKDYLIDIATLNPQHACCNGKSHLLLHVSFIREEPSFS